MAAVNPVTSGTGTHRNDNLLHLEALEDGMEDGGGQAAADRAQGVQGQQGQQVSRTVCRQGSPELVKCVYSALRR